MSSSNEPTANTNVSSNTNVLENHTSNNNVDIPNNNNNISTSVFTNSLIQNIEELERTQSLGVFEHLAAALQAAGGGGADPHNESRLTLHEEDHPRTPTNARELSQSQTAASSSPAARHPSVVSLFFNNNYNQAGGTSAATPLSGGGNQQLFMFDAENSSSNKNLSFDDHLAFVAHDEGSVAFARHAVEEHGKLEPMELALLQAESGFAAEQTNKSNTSKASEQQQVTAAEILASIKRLNDAEFSLLQEATYDTMMHGLSSHLMYSGSAWYLPHISETAEDEPESFVTCTLKGGLTMALCGSKVNVNVVSFIMRLCFLVIFWCGLYLFLGEDLMTPGGYVFDPLVCFLICSVVGGLLGRIFGMPPLVFILGFSILWANVGPSPKYLTKGIVKDLRSIISRTGLTIILIRSGLSMSLKTIKPAASNIICLAILPILGEILVHGFVATEIMDYGGSKLWPFLQAITAAPGASAVVGATVLLMRSWGYGLTRGPGILLLPSVVLDMVLGIWGINFMVSLVFRDESSNLGWTIGQGPVQIVVGPLAGLVAGWIWIKILKAMFREAKPLPHGKYSRAFIRSRARNSLAVMVLFGVCLVFGGYKIGAAGGGCLAAVFMAATAAHLMVDEGVPSHFPQVKAKQYGYLADIWDLVMMPLLFSIAASSIQVTTMFARDFFGKAIACLFSGIATRVVIAFFCSYSFPMTVSERIICAIVSAGRATVQVALGPLAAQTVAGLPNGGSADEKRYAAQVYDTAIIGVLIMTPISVILLTRVAPKFWMTDSEHARIAAEAAAVEEKELVQQQKQQEQEKKDDEEAAEPVSKQESSSNNTGGEKEEE